MSGYDCGFTLDDNWFRYRAAAIIVENDHVLFVGNDKEDYLYSVGGGVHMNETAEEAVLREVYEETGVQYEIDRLAVIHENFFSDFNFPHCHEISFYFLMKPKGTMPQLKGESVSNSGGREYLRWIPINVLHKYKAFPTFMQEYLQTMPEGVMHIVSHE